MIKRERFGKDADGNSIELFTIENSQGTRVKIMTLGAIIVGFEHVGKEGSRTDIVLGFDTLDEYLEGHPSFGTINGRYANRIDQGRFVLDGTSYQLSQNHQHGNHLHGGFEGIDKKIWQVVGIGADENSVALSYVSPDGEEGYPGKLSITVTYTLTDGHALLIDYLATTDAPTVLNLTNHAYFNLAGQGSVMDHELILHADHFTPINERVIPTGEIRSVEGTPFDFRIAKPIGRDLHLEDEQLKFGAGYDHNFVLSKEEGELGLAARVKDPGSGRILEMLTTEPGVQLYTANHLDGRAGKEGIPYHARHAFCLEAQHFPDSPNHPHFPSTVLRPGEQYRQTTIYRIIENR